MVEEEVIIKEVIQPTTANRPASWSQGIKSGSLLVTSGQVGDDEAGVIQHPTDIRKQAARAFANLEGVVEQAGGDRATIVKITAFLTSRENFAGYDEIRKEFFAAGLPASTTVIVKELVHPEYLLEIEALAIIPDADDGGQGIPGSQ